LQDEAIQQALVPKAPATVAISEADARAAMALLQSPDLMDRIVADFDACGIVGEATKQAEPGYLAAVSRKLDRPSAVVIQSSSAAGKSSLMDAVLAFMPEEERIKVLAGDDRAEPVLHGRDQPQEQKPGHRRRGGRGE
jgi:hypothetical protein